MFIVFVESPRDVDEWTRTMLERTRLSWKARITDDRNTRPRGNIKLARKKYVYGENKIQRGKIRKIRGDGGGREKRRLDDLTVMRFERSPFLLEG